MDFAEIPDKSLTECLALVERVFDSQEIAERTINRASLEEYYRVSDRGYRLFQSAQGALHLCLNSEGEFDTGGLFVQPGIVQRHLEELKAQDVLEAGCGNGFNILYLAKQNPQRRFVGIDWNNKHVRTSQKAGKDLANLDIRHANYEQLVFAGESFDLVMAIETLCQTENISAALREFHRLLRPGGRLIWIDCFRRASLEQFDDQTQLATALVERVTAVNAFPSLPNSRQLAHDCGFQELAVDDLTTSVAPNLHRLYVLARRFFNMSSGLWAMKRVFSPLMLENAICGLLSPFTFAAGVHGYYALALEKRK